MKYAIGIATVTLLTGFAPQSFAGSAPASMSPDTFLVQREMPRVSVGAGLELLERELRLDGGGPARMRADTLSGYLGVDLLHWFTAFGTLGRLDIDAIDIPGATGDLQDDRRWSFGINANVWHIDVEKPETTAGRLTIGIIGEYTQYDASGSGESLDWTEYAIAIPVGYSLLVEPRTLPTVYGAVFFAGPIYSTIDGDYTAGGRRTDFEEEQEIGLLAGANVYFAKNVVFGGQIQYFEKVSSNLSVRFHF